jgi:hypothetical protein
LTKRHKRGATEISQPLWLRTIAFACVLLVAVVSSAQVIHTHGKTLPNQTTQVDSAGNGSQLPGGEERCPLCVAMHSALPAVVSLQPIQLVMVECLPVVAVEHTYDAAWHFAMFSRPPPVRNL